MVSKFKKTRFEFLARKSSENILVPKRAKDTAKLTVGRVSSAVRGVATVDCDFRYLHNHTFIMRQKLLTGWAAFTDNPC